MRLLKPSSRIAATAAALALAAAPAAQAATSVSPPDTNYTTVGAWHFVSAPNLNPPRLAVNTKATRGLAGGDFFLANFKNLTETNPNGTPKKYVGESGPLIVDGDMNPVWFQPVKGEYTNNLREQTFEGKPALSFWQGNISGTGTTLAGEDIVVNQHYQTVATLQAEPGWVVTQHELIIQGHDAWVTANSLPMQVQGHTVIDSAVQEYDLTTCSKTGTGCKLVYSWDAGQAIPLGATHQAAPPFPGAAWDAYHINSIQLVGGGKQILVSLRNTWSAYLIDTANNQIVWTLDGSGNGGNFALPKNGTFAWQHDVELHPEKSGLYVSLFDDGCCELTYNSKTPFGPISGATRGLLLKLDTSTHTASYVHQYLHPAVGGSQIVTAFQGNMQLLPGGNVVIGWGSAPFFSEYTYGGKLLFDAQFPSPDVDYRAYLFAGWVGKPPLRLMHQAVKTVKGKTTVYALWDGATQVAAWRVLGGTSAKHLRPVATAVKTSFETAIRLAQADKVYKVQALDSHGHVLGTSSAFGAKTKSSSGGGGGFYGGY